MLTYILLTSWETLQLKYSKRTLIIHGFRTSGDILFMQTAAFRYHTGLDIVKINGPFKATGPPDEGIAEFYPNQSYVEWFSYDEVDGKTTYQGVDESINALSNFLDEQGPFQSILGFSQGGAVCTLLAEKQQQHNKNWFRFVILIGAVPPPPPPISSMVRNSIALIFVVLLL